MNDQTQPTLHLQRMYLKDCSAECPNSPQVFGTTGGETQFKIDLNVETHAFSEDAFEVVLTVKTTATMDDKTLFLIEVKYACSFEAIGYDAGEREHIINIWAPTQIFPYAREVVSSMSAHAGFPQLLLPSVNFEQYYQARKAQQATPADASPSIQ